MGNSYSAAHEFMHAMGFAHTQRRSDRELYVTVRLIPRPTPAQRKKNDQYEILHRPLEGSYDYDSVMHYRARQPPAIPSMIATFPRGANAQGEPANMGQRNRISAEDIRIINAVYR